MIRARSAVALVLASLMISAPATVAARDPAPGPAPAPDPATTPPPAATEKVLPAPAPVAASATPASPLAGDPSRPWAAEVPSDRQQAAIKKFEEANSLLKESLFVQAADRYRQALKSWDHPGIHYNLALALMNLDQPLEVHAHLKSALRYGPEPLDREKYDHARSYLKLVEQQLAKIEVHCDTPGAQVTMDGKPLFKAPGRQTALVRPGPHTFTAEKAGFPTTKRAPVAIAGQSTIMTLKLYESDELIAHRRRWSVWPPVAVTAAGAVLVGAGFFLQSRAVKNFDRYDQLSLDTCTGGAPVTSCAAMTLASDAKDRGNLFQAAAVTSYVIGGVTLATGAILLYLNRSVPYRIDEAEGAESAKGSPVTPTITPFVGPNGAGVVGTARF